METIGRFDPRLHRISKILLVVFKQREIAPAETVDGLPVVPHTEQFTSRVLGFQRGNQFIPPHRYILKLIDDDVAEFPGVSSCQNVFRCQADHIAEIDLIPRFKMSLVGFVNGLQDFEEGDVSFPEIPERSGFVFLQQLINGMVIGFHQGDKGLDQGDERSGFIRCHFRDQGPDLGL